MFAKIFASIFDSSIAEDWQTRVVFQDMLVLADKDGIVDMTPSSIARRTNMPLDLVRAAIPKLEAPDPSSRTQDHEGRRILRLDDHRDWGWTIANFRKYRESASKEMLRMAEADRKRAYREKFGRSAPSPRPPTKKKKQNNPGHVPDTSRTMTPLGTADRIGREQKLRILKSKLSDLEKDTAELWQRQTTPQLVRDRDDLRAHVARVEKELTA